MSQHHFSPDQSSDKRWLLLYLRLTAALFALLALRGGISLIQEGLERGVLFASLRYQTAVSVAFLFFLFSLLILFGSYWRTKSKLLTVIQRLKASLLALGRLNLVPLTGVNLILAFALLELGSTIFQPYVVRLLALALLVLLGMPFVHVGFYIRNPLQSLITSFLISSITLQILSLLTKVSTYPFTLEWSEASRYYYASLFLGERIYGVNTAWTVLHPSRYLLQAIPFLLPNSPLWFHRLWQVCLWIGLSGLTAYALLRRFGKPLSPWLRAVGAGWLFLFILLGPIYYHLQLAVLPLLLGFQPNARSSAAKGISTFVLILSSLWAGLSRLNWYPLPALIAITLYLLETPYRNTYWRYFWRPVLWATTGIGLAFAAHWGYIRLSGNPPEWFGTSLTSQLLWYRLLPNATYPPGILLASWIVILPIAFLLYRRYVQLRNSLHPWRWLGLFGILLALYVGGLVVSVKIGGGSNLHNLDAFWTSLGIVFTAVMTHNLTLDKSAPETSSKPPIIEMPLTDKWNRIALIAVIILPSLFLSSSLEPFFRPDWSATEKALRRLQSLVKQVPANREILFISERQLLTFAYLRDIRLVPEYERVFLMEMAMANNQPYLQQFYEDLREHRFALIVNEPLYVTAKGSPVRFGEENDAWVERVAKPLLCTYKPIQQARMLLMGVEIQILEPRSKRAEGCP